MIISENFEIIKPLIGGLLIGLSTSLLLFLNGKIAGISGITKGIIEQKSKLERGWRMLFIIGLVLGGLIINLFLPQRLFADYSLNLWLAIFGGLLVGVGTALGNGCTSGHGICGITRGSKRSITATIVFMASGMLTVFILKNFNLLIQGVQ